MHDVTKSINDSLHEAAVLGYEVSGLLSNQKTEVLSVATVRSWEADITRPSRHPCRKKERKDEAV